MPEATVNENGPSMGSIRNVRRAGEIFVSDSISQAERMKSVANENLRFGVALPNKAHAPRGFPIGYNGVDSLFRHPALCNSSLWFHVLRRNDPQVCFHSLFEPRLET